ncbi:MULTISPECIES: hypothetical protein [unclassified Ectothiorhodospira]|uniref:hypothetical protein n=1 Tax=unclassified Ectothiorhodospira TaxID=2684909 RepID=UPI001EE904DE|nr:MULTISPECIES: hypothetical protein [unclassified Ectothiorhodospira]MCG5516742.1 hypothetical protein [Ectothiorhodospira sp. 9100]MCG5519182.1 hypothetical protein [Ectothiorhodospira sp. 9905]
MHRFILPALLLMTLLLGTPAWGQTDWQLDIGDLRGEGWSMTGVTLRLGLAEEADTLHLQVARLRLPHPVGVIQDLEVACPGGHLQNTRLRCPSLRVSGRHPWLELRQVPGRLDLGFEGRLDLELEGLPLADGQVGLSINHDAGAWALKARGRALDWREIQGLAERIGQPLEDRLPDGFQMAGQLDLDFRARGGMDGIHFTQGRAVWDEGAFASAVGTLAGEGLGMALQWDAQRTGAAWQGDLVLDWETGAVYVDPVFVEADAAWPMQFSTRLNWREGRLSAKDLTLSWGDDLRLAGEAGLDVADPSHSLQATLNVDRARLPAVYETFVKPFAYGTALDDLDTGGLISARLKIREGTLRQVALTLAQVDADDRMGRLGLYGLDGRLIWKSDGTAPVSHVSLEGGHLYRIPVGMTRMPLQLERDGIRLIQEARIPILDGELRVHGLEARGLRSEDPLMTFEASVMPISMERLAATLGRPLFTGTLAGSIPRVRYQDGELTLGGRLVIQAFDGMIRVGNLRLRDPFGVAPVLWADIEMDTLDLASITNTFEFGLIEGRLKGHVRDMILVNWEPVRFDAALYTPLDQRFRRRISQRALDNLVSLGGGVGGMLGTGFLRFFDSFGYRQLGLSCQLRGEVCLMDGVAPAPDGDGYYIIQGAGLPRVEVIGHTRQVAWRDLILRLQAAVASGEVSMGDEGP